MTGKILGFINGVSKAGKPYRIAHISYKDPYFKGLGEKVAECFVGDDVVLPDESKILGSKCDVKGAYDKTGSWRIYINSIG